MSQLCHKDLVSWGTTTVDMAYLVADLVLNVNLCSKSPNGRSIDIEIIEIPPRCDKMPTKGKMKRKSLAWSNMCMWCAKGSSSRNVEI